MSVAYFTSEEHFSHFTDEEHPEHAMRILAIEQELKARHLWDQLIHIKGEEATIPDILRAHSKGYVDQLHLIQPEHGHIYVDEDTQMSPGSLRAALWSAGSCTSALDALMRNDYQHAFVATRPPGHHAEHMPNNQRDHFPSSAPYVSATKVKSNPLPPQLPQTSSSKQLPSSSVASAS